MLRTLARKLTCRHRAHDRTFFRGPGVEIEHCTACGSCWMTCAPGARTRVWWAP